MRFSRPLSPARAAALPALAAAAAVLAAVAAGGTRPAFAQTKYLAIGDSYAFGFSTFGGTPADSGINGYVDYVARNLVGATSANINSLVYSTARPGETLTAQSGATFSTATTANPFGIPNYNTNYAPGFTQSQQDLLNTKLADSSFRSGIQYVTVQIGGNDILGPILSAGFRAASEPVRQGAIANGFAQLQPALTTLLTNLHTSLPGAQILLVGYANPFAALADDTYAGVTPSSYPKTYAAAAVQQANALYASLAASITGVKYVDIYGTLNASTATLNQYTLINDIPAREGGEPNYHLTSAGYQKVGQLIVGAAAPEPGSCVLVVVGLLGSGGAVGVRGRFRRRG